MYEVLLNSTIPEFNDNIDRIWRLVEMEYITGRNYSITEEEENLLKLFIDSDEYRKIFQNYIQTELKCGNQFDVSPSFSNAKIYAYTKWVIDNVDFLGNWQI